MSFRTLGRMLLVLGVLIPLVLTTAGSAAPRLQIAVMNLTEPTLIGSTIVDGPVVFVHDMDRMARGEPCTSILLYEPGQGSAEELVSFHCVPRETERARVFTVKTEPNLVAGFGCVLTAYQFAGDTEEHGIPPR